MNLHHAILRAFVDRGHPPTTRELSAELGTDAAPLLRELAADHGVVLHPDSTEIWIAHPFSASPTAVWVTAGPRGWWAPCLWCACGIAALVGDVAIHARYGGETDAATFTVSAGRIAPAACVHFPIPARDAWVNVVHWCAAVQPFRTPADITDWARRHGMQPGAVVELDRVLALAHAWYGGHLAADWRKHTVDEAGAIFAAVGLTGAHWELPAAAGRF